MLLLLFYIQVFNNKHNLYPKMNVLQPLACSWVVQNVIQPLVCSWVVQNVIQPLAYSWTEFALLFTSVNKCYIYNLRSGYAKFNDYCHKLNITESANCQCGERETVEYYILHCDQYEEAREKLIHDMFLLSGSMHLSLEVLLTVGTDEEVSLTETEWIRLLADYIQETKCFDL